MYLTQTTLTLPPCTIHHPPPLQLYNCQMKLVEFLSDISLARRMRAQGQRLIGLLCSYSAAAYGFCVLSLSHSPSLSRCLSAAVSVCCLSRCGASVSRLVSFFMSSVRQMSNGTARSDWAGQALGICLCFLYHIEHIVSGIFISISPNARTARAAWGVGVGAF